MAHSTRTITQYVVTPTGTHPDSGHFWPLLAQTVTEARAEYARDASIHNLPTLDQVTLWRRESTLTEAAWSRLDTDDTTP